MTSKWDDWEEKREEVTRFLDIEYSQSVSNIALAQIIYCDIGMAKAVNGASQGKKIILAYYNFLKDIGEI